MEGLGVTADGFPLEEEDFATADVETVGAATVLATTVYETCFGAAAIFVFDGVAFGSGGVGGQTGARSDDEEKQANAAVVRKTSPQLQSMCQQELQATQCITCFTNVVQHFIPNNFTHESQLEPNTCHPQIQDTHETSQMNNRHSANKQWHMDETTKTRHTTSNRNEARNTREKLERYGKRWI